MNASVVDRINGYFRSIAHNQKADRAFEFTLKLERRTATYKDAAEFLGFATANLSHTDPEAVYWLSGLKAICDQLYLKENPPPPADRLEVCKAAHSVRSWEKKNLESLPPIVAKVIGCWTRDQWSVAGCGKLENGKGYSFRLERQVSLFKNNVHVESHIYTKLLSVDLKGKIWGEQLRPLQRLAHRPEPEPAAEPAAKTRKPRAARKQPAKQPAKEPA
jgi:hypothetical protein